MESSAFNASFSGQLLALVLITGLMTGYFFFQVWKRKLMKSTNFQWQEMILRTAHGGYYVWDARRESEYFSLNLVNIFRMRGEQQVFGEFVKFFEYEKDIFERAFNELTEGTKQRFAFNVRANICGRTHYFLCSGYRVENGDYGFEGVILWFFDVTDYILKMQEMTDDIKDSRKEKRNMQSVLNLLPFPVWQRDSHGKIIFCNQAYSNCTEDKRPDDAANTVPELYRGMHEEALETLRNEGAFNKERNIVINGNRVLTHIHEAASDRAGGCVGFALDISQEEELRKEMKAHVGAYSDLLESSSSAMAVYGKDTKLAHYNGAFLNQFGLDAEYLDGKPVYQDVLEKLRAARQLPEQKNFAEFRKEQLGLFQRELKEPYNEFFHLPDGRYLRMIAIPHALGGLLFVYEDLTDNLRIRSSYNRLVAVQKATLDNLKEGILLAGSDGCISLFNPRICEIFPESEHILAGEPHIKDALEAFRPAFDNIDDWHAFREDFAGRAASRMQMTVTEEIAGKIYNISFIPLPDARTLISFLEVTSSVVLERTLTERNKALEEADKVKNDFLAGISYDLRTPLTSIIGFSETLQAEYFGGLEDTQKEYVADIYNSANQLLAMINNIIDIARIRAGKMELKADEAELHKLPEAAVRLVEGAAAEKGVRLLSENRKARGVTVICDAARVTQMLFYVLHKAVNAASAAGADAVRLVTETADKDINGAVAPCAVFTVILPYGDGARAFNDAGAADGEDLSGLFVSDVAERHNGVIEAAPRESGANEGEYRFFACYLPLRQDPALLEAPGEAV